jgi:hypothetical protein
MVARSWRLGAVCCSSSSTALCADEGVGHRDDDRLVEVEREVIDGAVRCVVDVQHWAPGLRWSAHCGAWPDGSRGRRSNGHASGRHGYGARVANDPHARNRSPWISCARPIGLRDMTPLCGLIILLDDDRDENSVPKTVYATNVTG